MTSSSRPANRKATRSVRANSSELTSNRSILLLMGLLVAAFFVFGYLDRVNELAAARSEIASLQEDVAQAEQRNAELKATLNEVAGETYVGETARAELGLIQPGDDPFVLLGPDPSGDTAAKSSRTVSATDEVERTASIDIFSATWWRSLLGQ